MLILVQLFSIAAICAPTAHAERTAEELSMTDKQQEATDVEDSMAKILLKIFGLGIGCIVAAWGIIKILEKF